MLSSSTCEYQTRFCISVVERDQKFPLSMSFFQNKKNIKYKNSMTGVPVHKRENDDNGNDNDGDNCCIVICGYYGGKKGCLMDV